MMKHVNNATRAGDTKGIKDWHAHSSCSSKALLGRAERGNGLLLALCAGALFASSAFAQTQVIPQPGMPNKYTPPMPMGMNEYIESLQSNPNTPRDSKGRLLFDPKQRALAKRGGDGRMDSAEDTQVRRVIVRLKATQPSVRGESVAARSAISDVERVFKANGEDWRRAAVLQAPRPAQQPQAARMTSAKAAAFAKLREAYERTFVVPVSDSARVGSLIRSLSSLPGVEFAQPEYSYKAAVLPENRGQQREGAQGDNLTQNHKTLWGLQAVAAREAWKITKGRGVVVAVVDTGINRLHTQLRDQVWRNRGEIPDNCIDDDNNGFIDDHVGWSFVDEMDFIYYGEPGLASKDCGGTRVFNETMDIDSHGSHVAGTIAAAGRDSSVVGVAPEATVMAVKGLNDYGYGYSDGLALSIAYAAYSGADVINNSWGRGPHFQELGEDRLIEEAIAFAHELGSVVIFAAGNNFMNSDRTANGSVARPVISVGALRKEGMDYNVSDYFSSPSRLYSVKSEAGRLLMASFSNYGHAVDISAPGVDVRSSIGLPCSGEEYYTGACQVTESSGYAEYSGTSMAAPHVAGVAALVKAANPSLTPAEVRSLLITSASKSVRNGAPDPFYGAGVVNAGDAVKLAARTRQRGKDFPVLSVLSPKFAVSLSSKDELRITARIGNAQTFTATLFDYDGTFTMASRVTGREVMRMRSFLLKGETTTDLRMPLKGLKSGRYLVSLTAQSSSGLIREFVPFAVDDSTEITLSSYSFYGGETRCLRSRGDWMMWYEVAYQDLGGIYSLKVANTKTGVQRTLFAYNEVKVSKYDRITHFTGSTCPMLLNDGTAAWIVTKEDLTYFDFLDEPGREPPPEELMASSTLFRANLSDGSVLSQELPYMGFVRADTYGGPEDIGISTNGSDIVFMSQKFHFERAEDGLFLLDYSTGFYLLKAGSMMPVTLLDDKALWSPRFLVGPLSNGEVTVGGIRGSGLLGDIAWEPKTVNISVKDGGVSVPRWATPSIAEAVDRLRFWVYFGPSLGDLFPIRNELPSKEVPRAATSFLPSGLSIFDGSKGISTRIAVSSVAIGHFFLSDAGLSWIEVLYRPDSLLGMPSIEGQQLRTNRRTSMRSFGFRGSPYRAVSTPQGFGVVAYDANSNSFDLTESVKLFNLTK